MSISKKSWLQRKPWDIDRAMKPRAHFRICVLLFAFLLTPLMALTYQMVAESWNQFRGPTGQGITNVKSLPTHWNEQENVAWKTPIHDRGWSSPIIADGKAWLTTATETGHQLYVVAVNLDTGAIMQDEQLFTVKDPQFAHKFNSYASPTPVTDGNHVYVTFGSPGTACLDTKTGKVLWERVDIECNHFRGAGSSPILYNDLLIMNFDGSDHQFIIALDKLTGKTKWMTKRSIDYQDLGPDGKPEADGDWRKSFSTPHVALFNGTPTLLSIGSKALYAYQPLTGKEFWRTESRIGHSASTRPTVIENMIYYSTGFSKGEIWAVKPGGQGNVTKSHVKWIFKRSVPNKPSLIWKNDRLFMIHDGGVATCLDSSTGKTIWQERIGGNYSASPLLWKDLIYFFSEEGKTTIIKADDSLKIIAVNELESGFMASPVVSNDALILRTKSHLFKIKN
jgi:outer membrane protein assembly factor BamB